jgi:ABC-type nitrate/sulfonate/bicarbonate transport system permease component
MSSPETMTQSAGEVGEPPAPAKLPGVRGGFSGRNRYWITLLSLVVALVLWEFVARVVIDNPLFFPTLPQVWGAGVEAVKSGQLWEDISISAQEFLLGYVIGSVAAILLGGLVSSSMFLRRFTDPWVYLLYSTPIIALAPLFILWFGIGILSKVAIVVLMVFFPVFINTRQGLETTEQAYVDVARSYGATELQLFSKVRLLSAVPYVLVGLRLSVARGIIAVSVGEFFGAAAGLGFRITEAGQTFDSAGLFVAVIVLAVVGMVGTSLLSLLERRIAPWRFQN